MNIYDFAGNVWEWTLECNSAYPSGPCAGRGGRYSSDSSDAPAAYRGYGSTTDAKHRRWIPQRALLMNNCLLRKSPRLGLYVQPSLIWLELEQAQIIDVFEKT